MAFDLVKDRQTEDVFNRLKEGNLRFYNEKNEKVDLSKLRRDELSEGQNPFAVVIGCSDSRVPLSFVFNQGLGDIFEIRLAGNVLNKEALGSMEYAIECLNVSLVVVLGHEKCGAVSATVDYYEDNMEVKSNIKSIVGKIKPAYDKRTVANNNRLELNENVCNINIEMVRDEVINNNIVKEKMNEGKLNVVMGKYFLDGKVEWL